MPKYVVSACLLGCNCKYNGANNFNLRVQSFLRGKEYITVCPEVDGGLTTPRLPAEIRGGTGEDVLQKTALVLNNRGTDVSSYFLAGAMQTVGAARDFGADVAILKERSPSCGVSYVYGSNFNGQIRHGRGVAAAALAEAGVKLFSEENMPWGWSEMNYQDVTNVIVNWLQEKAAGANARGYVVGLSGGVDSAVTAALIKRAFPDNSLGVILPIESSPEDAEDARLVASGLNLEVIEADLGAVFSGLLATLEPGARSLPNSNLAVANIKPRLRMLALYYYAARRSCLVAGTGNKSELVSGFFTKYGDGAVDVEPLGQLVKTEIWELARFLNIPGKIIDRVPTAGLWPGQTDEAELGFTYKQLDQYIRTGRTDPEVQDKIESLTQKIRHKLEPPPSCPL